MFSFFRPATKVQVSLIAGEELHRRMASKFAPWCDAKHIFIGDRKYSLPSKEDGWKSVCAMQSFYRPEVNDCDDLVRAADYDMKRRAQTGEFGGVSPAFGYLWTENHAYNVWMDAELQVWLCDGPGNVFSLSEFSAQVARFVIL